MGCTSLTDIKLPNGIAGIGMDAFGGCSGITEIRIPKNTTTISDHTFCNCENLETVIIPQNIIFIHQYAFINCPKLKVICYENSYTESFCKENGINYELIPDIKAGDIDCDGHVTASDAALILQKTMVESCKLPIQDATSIWMMFTDVDCDDNITAGDAALVLQRTLTPSLMLPCEKD